ncbi:MAG TPA: ATP-dependent DNA ligase, partial [Gemmatimonadales bacterium]
MARFGGSAAGEHAVRLHELVDISRRVAATRARREKVQLLASLLGRVTPDEIEVAVGFLVGWPRQGRLGVGWAALEQAKSEPPSLDATLELLEVDRSFARIKSTSGKGSSAGRVVILRALFARALPEEHEFLIGLIMGELRQGALEGVMVEAVAQAAGIPAARVRRAAMLAGDLGKVALAALTRGEAGLAQYSVRLFQPLQPMLADSAENVAEALATLGRAGFEFKLDGARVQVHRSGPDVAVYTRNLNDVTAAVPEVVEAALGLALSQVILDGEVLALDSAGRPLPFQLTMRRFGRKLDVERLRAELPVRPFFFDILLLDGEELLDQTYTERMERLSSAVPPEQRVPQLVSDSVAEAEGFFSRALSQGHEGVMAKALEAPYEAGRRGKAWLKVKRARTLDLVVLAAEWGHGRRRGTLSNLHLGARGDANGEFVMLGKTFKGMTDEMLAWQTGELLARETERDQYTVYVRPELVVEVAFNEIQESPVYTGGLTLRFARVVRYRPDKEPGEADSF